MVPKGYVIKFKIHFLRLINKTMYLHIKPTTASILYNSERGNTFSLHFETVYIYQLPVC